MANINLPINQYVDGAGPLVGSKAYFYAAGSTVPKNVYNQPNSVSVATQPIIADANGIFPQVFSEDGMYRVQLYDRFDNLLATRDYVDFGGGSASIGVDSYKVMVTSEDTVPNYLDDKIADSATVQWIVETDGSGNQVLKANVDNSNVTGDHKVKATATDATPGFLNSKISSTGSIALSVVNDKIQAEYVGPYLTAITEDDDDPAYLGEKLEDTDTVNWEISGYPGGQHIRANVQNGAGDTYKFKYDVDDSIPGFAGAKIKAGTGITINTTTDDTDGTVMHINNANTATGKVKVNNLDTYTDYLEAKLVAGPGMTITPVVSGATTLVLAPLNQYLSDVRNQINRLNVGLDYPNVQNVCSLVLTPGTWEVEGSVVCYVRATTDVKALLVGNISTVAATIDTDGYDQWAQSTLIEGYDTTWAATNSITIPRRRLVVTATQTIYLVAQQGVGPFTICQMWGNLTARKIT